jgi:D-sedoheptulose 7-phosphate isomerase
MIEARFREAILASIGTKQRLLENLQPSIAVAEVLIDAYRNSHAILIFGNGGSAADAQHIAAELVGRFRLERPALRAEALTVNTSVLTAIANDFSFGAVYARQIEASGHPGDVAIGLSTSGRSPNVVRALETARRLGLRTVAMTGSAGGPSSEAAEFWVGIPCADTPRIQEAHIMIGHIWCELIEAAMAADAERAAAVGPAGA